MKSKLFNLAKVVISAALLAYVLLTIDLRELGEAMLHARWGHLILAELLVIVGLVVRAIRWGVLLQALDIRVPLVRLTKLYFVGTFFNIFLPTGLGGDAVRMMELSRTSHKTPESIGTVLVDRATGLWVLFVMALLALPFAYHLIPTQVAVTIGAIAAAGVVGGWLVMGTRFVPWLGSKVRLPGQDKLERFYRAISGCGYVALGKACGTSLLFNLLMITTNYLIALAYGVDLPIGVFFLFTPILSMALMLPSVGGLGVREETYKQMFRTVGVSASVAVAMSLTNFLLQPVIPGLIGGVLYAIEGASALNRQESEA